MSPPVEPSSIEAGEWLWRRVHPTHWVDDGQGGRRVSSGAFTPEELSVDRAMVLKSRGLDHLVTQSGGGAVAQFAARVARDLDQAVRADPLPDNDAHAFVGATRAGS